MQAVSCPRCGHPLNAPTAFPAEAVVQGNGSGTGARAVLPAELRGFNWGAFLLGLFWAIAHNTWIGLLTLVPYVGWVMIFALGFKGNEWAWQNRRWESVEQFKKVQRDWAIWGIVLGLVFAVVGGGYWFLLFNGPLATPAPPAP